MIDNMYACSAELYNEEKGVNKNVNCLLSYSQSFRGFNSVQIRLWIVF